MTKSNPRVTISMPCYGRPARTKRAIQCILDQDINGWEAFIMGDNCPHFQKLIDSGYLSLIKKEQEAKGNTVHFFNATKRGGGWGYVLTNHAIKEAKGEFFLFYDNDDVILPNHMRHYLSEIEDSSLDMVFYNSLMHPTGKVRNTVMGHSNIGHCDVIVRTSVLRQAPIHDKSYAHDWNVIHDIASKRNTRKSKSMEATYWVMRLPNEGTKDTID